MAWTAIGGIGSAADKSAGTSIAMTTSATVEVNNVIVVLVAKDNAATTNGNTNEITSVTDSTGANTYTKAREFCNSRGAADGGATVAVYYSKLGTQLSSGGTITANFSDTRTASAISAVEFTITSANTVSVEGNATDEAVTNGDAGSMTISGLTSREYLFIRAVAQENNSSGFSANTANYINIATNGTAGGGSASNMGIAGEFRILTGTGDTSDPTVSTNSDSASVYIALKEASNNPVITADSGNFAFGGTAATVKADRKVTASTAAHAFTGTDAGLAKGRTLVAETAAFAFGGTAATLLAARKIVSDSAAHAFGGTNATFAVTLPAASGAFAFGGTDAGLLAGRKITAESGNIAFTGTDATLTVGGAPAATYRSLMLLGVG